MQTTIKIDQHDIAANPESNKLRLIRGGGLETGHEKEANNTEPLTVSNTGTATEIESQKAPSTPPLDRYIKVPRYDFF